MNLEELKKLAEKNLHVRFYTESPELKDDIAYFTAANPATILTLISAIETYDRALEYYCGYEDGIIEKTAGNALETVRKSLEDM